jgi:RNA polymerase sigma-70 factor (ECF subfamily)
MIRRPLSGHSTGVEPQSARALELPLGVAPPRAVGRLGDDARLRALVDAHFDFVWRSLRRLGVPAPDVDDCAQQVFWVTARKLADVEAGSERAFLFSTAWRVAADARRARTRRREVNDDDTTEAEDHGPDPEQLADQRRARAVLDEVLDAMPIDLRAPFVLFELEELPTAEIATLLDLPIGTVASRLRRAREEFRSMVARRNARGAGRGGKP